MAFVVEDGTGLATANAYITVQEMKDYHKDRGNTIEGGNTELQQQIVKATDYIEQRWGELFRSSKEFPEVQALSFPKFDLLDRDGFRVEGIPDKLKNATAEYALIAASGDLFVTGTTDSTGLTVQRSKDVIGPIETERTYITGGTVQNVKKYPEADRWLDEYIKSSSRLVRG